MKPTYHPLPSLYRMPNAVGCEGYEARPPWKACANPWFANRNNCEIISRILPSLLQDQILLDTKSTPERSLSPRRRGEWYLQNPHSRSGVHSWAQPPTNPRGSEGQVLLLGSQLWCHQGWGNLCYQMRRPEAAEKGQVSGDHQPLTHSAGHSTYYPASARRHPKFPSLGHMQVWSSRMRHYFSSRGLGVVAWW